MDNGGFLYHVYLISSISFIITSLLSSSCQSLLQHTFSENISQTDSDYPYAWIKLNVINTYYTAPA